MTATKEELEMIRSVDETFKACKDLAITFLLLPIAVIVKGYVAQTGWNWFLVPLGLVPLNMPTAIGLFLLLMFVVPTPRRNEKTSVVQDFFFGLAWAGLSLLLLYITHLFL